MLARLLDAQPTDHVLEVGFGPGFANAEVVERPTSVRRGGNLMLSFWLLEPWEPCF
jgi:protein-L-isoaspartate O-methyltransferase